MVPRVFLFVEMAFSQIEASPERYKMVSKQDQEKKLYLSNCWIVILFGYYGVVFILGTTLAVLAIVPKMYFSKLDIIEVSLLGAIGMACNGSAIFYIRKLYKLCFLEHLQNEASENTFLRRLGTIAYFTARPLFAIGFAILIVISLVSAFKLTNAKPPDLDIGFTYLTMSVSFFGGFLTGRFIKILETKGEKVLSSHYR